jgi:hypothetical protein
MATINHKTYNEATETFKDFSVYDGKETLIFKVDGSEGNVGIGTSSPTSLLDVYNGSGWGTIDLDGISGGEIRLQKNGTSYGNIYASDAGSTAFVINAVTSNDLLFQTNSSERMRITSAGNVGIGTSSPATKLDVAFPSDGTAGAVFGYTGGTNNPRIFFNVNESTSKGQIIMSGSSGALDLGIGAGGTEIITLKGTGNVGIGTTSPTSLLNLSSATPILTLNQNTANSEQGIEFDTSDVNYAFIRANAVTGLVSYAAGLTGGAGYVHRFIVDGSERLRITPNGLTFNGDTAAANALDDYEEGTWTPQISNGTTNVAISNSYSTYTKIGRQVTVNTRMVNGDLSSFSSGDNISFIGLPFTSGGDYYSTIYVRGAVSGNLVRLLAIGNGTTTAATDLFVSELVDGASDYWFTATYFV